MIPGTEGGPDVTVGLPVRNPGPYLGRAIESVLQQTYRRLRLVIVDNASTDGTRDYCAALRDPRVAYLRHDQPIPAIRNFCAAWRASSTPFFMWVAHDDVRSANYVEVLVAALERHPEAVLAFPELFVFGDIDTPELRVPQEHKVATLGGDLRARLRQQATSPPFHIYGLIRREALAGYPWYETGMAADWPVMAWLAARGPFVQASEAWLAYYLPKTPKSEARKAHDNALRAGRRWPLAQVTWSCADSVWRARGAHGLGLERAYWWPTLYVWHGKGLRVLLYGRSPAWARRLWQALRRRQVAGAQRP